MVVHLEECNWFSLDKLLDQNHFLSIFFEGQRELNILPLLEHFDESIQIFHLEGEVDLLN